MEYSVKGFENALRIYKDVVERGENLVPNTARVRGSRFYFNTDAKSEVKSVIMDESDDIPDDVPEPCALQNESTQNFNDADIAKHQAIIYDSTKGEIVDYILKEFGVELDSGVNKPTLQEAAIKVVMESNQ